MLKLHKTNSQNAQGMVEFALVLPVLLLLILGIIAFGHLFFVYSFTVSASREAARWGSAVGVTGSGLPRFRDCDAILDTAVRVGGMAGVRPGNIMIEYDHGPDSGPAYAGCPAGGEGPDVTLSDRILVTVKVNYTPIVPLINIPEIPLSATTARTIIRGLPVGEAPTIPPSCISTFFEIKSETSPLDEDQLETFSYAVKSPGPNQPTNGRVIIRIDGDVVHDKVYSGTSPISGTFDHTYDDHGEFLLTAMFESTDYQFCKVNPPSAYMFKVRRKTVVEVTKHEPPESVQGEKVWIEVRVEPATNNPRSLNAPTGVVEVKDRDYPGIGCTITLLPNGTGACEITGLFDPGDHYLIIQYTADVDFSPAEVIEIHTVKAPPTIIPTPTKAPTATPMPTPTPKPVCPILVTAFNFTDQRDGFWISIQNLDNNSAKLASIALTWPSKSGIDAQLKEVRYASTTTNSCDRSNLTPDCIWVGPNPLEPTYAEIGDRTSNRWSDKPDLSLAAGATKQLRFVFTSELPNTVADGTKYSLSLGFDNPKNLCSIVIPDTDRQIEQP